MKILQINLNHCRLAHYLLPQTAMEEKADLILIAEPLYNPDNWIMSTDGKSAIWVTGYNGNNRMEDGDRSEGSFSAVRLKNLTVISVYISPNTSDDLYALKIEEILALSKQEKRLGRSVLVGGDFNARSPVWGSEEQNAKGTILLDAMLRRDIFPVRPIGGPTFERGKSVSHLDFVAVTPDLVCKDKVMSKVLDTETASDHKYILTELKLMSAKDTDSNSNFSRWRVNTHGLNKLKSALDKQLAEEGINQGNYLTEEQEKRFLNIITRVCEESLDKIEAGKERKTKSNSWWNQEIKEERSKVQKLRRKIQKARKKNLEEERQFLTFLYKKEKKRLQSLIRKEKDKVWNEMCEEIEKDPWGKPYKLVIRRAKKGSPPATLSPTFAEEVMQGLFPQRNLEYDPNQEETEQDPVYEQQEQTQTKTLLGK